MSPVGVGPQFTGGPQLGGYVGDLTGPNGDQAFSLLAQELNDLLKSDPKKVEDALKQLKQMPIEQLMMLLLLLDPEVQQALQQALGAGAAARGGGGGGGGGARPAGGGARPAGGGTPRAGGRPTPAPSGMTPRAATPGNAGATPRGVQPAGTGTQPAGTPRNTGTPAVPAGERGRTVGDTNIPRQDTYAPGSPEARALFSEAARMAGLPPEWGNSEALHNILRRESGGQVGRPNYTYGDRARDPSQWGSIHDELKNGQITARSSATGLGQLLLSNVDKYYPNGRAGIGDPLQEAAGMLRYIADRYGTPENAWRLYGTRHEGY